MGQDQETLGRYLRREREKRHVTVEELALFLGVPRSLVEALDADNLACFSGRADCLRLVKRYSGYLHLDRTEAVRRFDGQWKTSAGLPQFPKLTHYGDDASRRRRPLAGVSGARMAMFALLGALLLAVAFLGSYLPDLQRKLASPPQPAAERAEPAQASPDRPAPAQPGPAAGKAQGPGIVKKAGTPAGEGVAPPPAQKAVAAAAPKPKHAPAVDPLYTPPGRGERKAAAPSVKSGTAAPLPKAGRVVGNRDSKRYHLPGMKYYDKVKQHHRVVFPSEQEAIRAGYVKAPQ